MARLIELKQTAPERFLARFDTGEEVRTTLAVVTDFHLRSGKELTSQELDALRAASERSRCRQRALRIIGARAMSVKELTDRLKEKGESPENAAAWLHEIHLLDDAQYAAMCVRHYAAKGYGAGRIRSELYRRGIPRELWDDALQELPEQDDQIDTLLRRRLRSDTPDRDELRRASDYLYRRGFGRDEIRAAIARYQDNYEEYCPMPYRICLISLGCAKNQVNSEQMLYLLNQAGHEVVGEVDGCDVAIVNTCGFIDSAKSEAIDQILQLAEVKKAGGLKKILVTGCLSQRYENDILESLPEVDGMLGTGSFGQICEAVEDVMHGGKPLYFGDKSGPIEEIGRVVTTGPGWAYLRIAEGCDNWCAFCAIPAIRGRYRSRTLDAIVQEAKDLADLGVKELIVIAQDITRWGMDLYGRPSLALLLRELAKIDGIRWIRLHYLYPEIIDDELIDLIADEDKIVKYLDIPIQHINNDILRRMNRHCTGDEIRALLQKLRARIPGLVLRTSLITGLPGEGEAEFEELCTWLREVRLERVGVFPFSPEEGTPAAVMTDRCEPDEAQRRADLILELQAGIMDDYNAACIGRDMTVLCEHRARSGMCSGRTYADSPEIDGTVYFTGTARPGDMVTVHITGCDDGDLAGEQIHE